MLAFEMKYSSLSPERILQTQQRLRDRIAKRFPKAGLRGVADELAELVGHAAQRAEEIRQPHIPFRLGVGAVLLVALGLLVVTLGSLQLKTDLHQVVPLVEFFAAVLSIIVFLGAAVLFLLTLEGRMKRRRALNALHELRSFAHVVDMHQVAKDPEGLVHRHTTKSMDEDQTTKTLFDLNRYLNYCNELLAIVSKVAALYVQNYPDPQAVAAVDQVESLCFSLSQKIWQKLRIVDGMMAEQESLRSEQGSRGAGEQGSEAEKDSDAPSSFSPQPSSPQE